MHPLFKQLQAIERTGEIEQHIGVKITANGPPQSFVGELCEIYDTSNQPIMQAEVLGFEKGKVYLMPYSQLPLQMGYQVKATGSVFSLPVGNALLGQMIDAFGHPLLPGKPLVYETSLPTQNKVTHPLDREPITERFRTGVHAIDGLITLGKGQRVGLFAGSGVGKSHLLGEILKHSSSEVNVIALIGERGREVNDLLHHLSPETLKKSVIVVACSDDSALKRRQALLSATTIAEYFCNQNKDVLLLTDSITRFAMAQREIGLSLGEPPTARGYTPSVFSLLPGVVERAGNFKNKGSITAIYTVLVEGDDLNEPVTDHMRSLLDGHIVLSRELAQKNHYPAISILQSISRLNQQLLSQEEYQRVKDMIQILSLYQQSKDFIEIGAYKEGANPKLDKALHQLIPLQNLLTQTLEHPLPFEELQSRFKEILR